MLPVSVCIIAKNEEKYIGECLQRLTAYDWEIVVADTGSTDQTIEIARQYTSHIYSFPWCDDFSAARNFCISKASNHWILNIDCDEYLTNTQSESELLALLNPVLKNPSAAGMVNIINPHAASVNTSVSVDPVARFFHKRYYQYHGKVHEQAVPSGTLPAAYVKTPFSLYHTGYSNEFSLTKKASRNILLLKKELQNTPEDTYLFFQLGQSYFVTGDYEKAYLSFEQGLAYDVNPALQYVRTMVESYGYCLLHLKKYDQALQLEGIYEDFCSHADFVFLMGLIYMNHAMFEKAIEQFLKAAQTENHSVTGINSYLAYYNIGVIYECLGKITEAHDFYLKCGEYPPALAALKRLTGN